MQTLGPGDWLPPRDGHRVWWCEGGDPRGQAVLVVHGGPGGASRVDPSRWFEGLPLRWIMVDQRGCGRSTPLGATAANRLTDLLDDMERLRQQLGLAGWALAGGSWGARVALRYAAGAPQRVRGLLLRSPFLGNLAETRRYIAPWNDWLGAPGRDWLGAAAAAAVQALYQEPAELSSYDTSMTADPLADERVAQAWSAYDDAQSAPGGVRGDAGRRFDVAALPKPTEAVLASWAVHRHHARRGWGEADGHPRGAESLPAGLGPVHVVWGDADATCDPAAARSLAAAWPQAAASEVAGAGHRMGDPGLAPVLAASAHAWAARLLAA